ncbi:MAG TPA: FAD-dependent oxidoreductase [Candidatus Hydrogenedentes bacterium]|nr:FAD-dependent oxidoreductase [Candidatus Hydrogenedentota bacterium]
MTLLLSIFGCLIAGIQPIDGKYISESAREIPVMDQVDVVIAGGSAGAVQAALAARQAGATVFLISQYPYLGEDMCATGRLWLEPGEQPDTPLAKSIYMPPPALLILGETLPFQYQADASSVDPHKDTDPPAMLCDKRWESAIKESVQFNDDVTVLLDLGKECAIGKVHLIVFQRDADIETARATFSGSVDREHWADPVTVVRPANSPGAVRDMPIALSASLPATARYIKVHAEKAAGVPRQLLGEIIVEAPETNDSAPQESSIPLPPTPMQVKSALENALLEAGVQFLFGCYATDVLRDEQGQLSGIVVANRAGRQAIRAKMIIDATPRATVARIAGAEFSTYAPGMQTFSRIVIGGTSHPGENVQVQPMPTLVQIEKGLGSSDSMQPAFEYSLALPMTGATFASFARAEQIARDKTWDPGQLLSSEELYQLPPDYLLGREFVETSNTLSELPIGVFRPQHEECLYVFGPSASVSRALAAKIARPIAAMHLGERLGRHAAEEAKKVTHSSCRVSGQEGSNPIPGEIREPLLGERSFSTHTETIPSPRRAAPILGEYDVVVVGGGTGGAPAGISAARQGARTLVIEYQHGLGGVSTLGLIGKYYHGYRGGFTREIDQGVKAMGPDTGMPADSWNIEWRMEWYRRELLKAGADLWFGAIGCGAVVENQHVKGVVVATPLGRGVVLAKTVIDATGNADVAVAAGAESITTDANDLAVQGTGMPPRQPGASYTNTDYTLTDDTDIRDVWRTLIAGRTKYHDAYDLAPLVDSRERRRILGDFVISPLDIWNDRTYPDAIGIAQSDFDTHGYTLHPMFLLTPPHKKSVRAYTPYRSLLPHGIEGMLVIGLGISAHRDAMPILRMQPDIQNQGYAAGVAAVMAAKNGGLTRTIDLKALQEHLVKMDCLPNDALKATDSYPATQERIDAAVRRVANDYEDVALVLANWDTARPLVKQAFASAESDKARLIYAHILGITGEGDGAPALATAVEAQPWDEGWRYTGSGQYGASYSAVDSYLIALANTHAPNAVSSLLSKLNTLNADSEFSHHRSIALACETLGDKEAAPALAALLKKPGMQGYACKDIPAVKKAALQSNPNQERDQSLRELFLARALYRCGDYEGLGKRILEEYAQDLRGHLARHARLVLSGAQ